MPKLADHDARRREITDAARRVIAREGLPAATFASVAAEAGVSVRLVQYYFGTKRDVLLATYRAVAVDAGGRFAHRLAALGDGASPRDVVRAILVEVLPTDRARREDAVVLDAFFMEVLTRPADAETGVTAEESLGAPGYLVDAVATQLQRLRPRDPVAAELDARLVVAAASGLAQSMLVDPEAVRLADALLDRLLDLLLEPSGA